MIYVAYVVLRAFAGDGEAEKKFAAALGILGAANLPIIHYAVQKWSGQHPVVIGTGAVGSLPRCTRRCSSAWARSHCSPRCCCGHELASRLLGRGCASSRTMLSRYSLRSWGMNFDGTLRVV